MVLVIYGIRIISDRTFSLPFPKTSPFKKTLTLKEAPPTSLKASFTCGTYLHTTHKHRIFLYSNQSISKPLTAKQPLCYEVEGKLRFYWYYKDTTLYYEIIDTASENFDFWFAHTFFPLFLSMEKYYTLLHGSAVEIEGRSILFLAPYKSGKSTLTHYLSQEKGYPLITDDILPTWIENDTLHYAPSHPFSRPFRQTQTIGDKVEYFKNTFGKIDAVYILQNHSDTTETTIRALKGIEKFTLVRKNSLIYTLKSFRLDHEAYLGRLLNIIPFFVIERPWGKEHIPRLYNKITEHIHTL